MDLPNSNDSIKKNPSQVFPAPWVLVNSRSRQVDSKNNGHTYILSIYDENQLFVQVYLPHSFLVSGGLKLPTLPGRPRL